MWFNVRRDAVTHEVSAACAIARCRRRRLHERLPVPAPAGAWIDRSRSLGFHFDGSPLQGHPGDTLASALLASGTVHIGRSFKAAPAARHSSHSVSRSPPAWSDREGARRTPNTRATDIGLHEGPRGPAGQRLAQPALGLGA
jgi:sarcosine oxidase subunit alpha